VLGQIRLRLRLRRRLRKNMNAGDIMTLRDDTENENRNTATTEKFNIFSVSLRVTLFSKEPKADS
jgi:hypothetical protein